MKLVDHAKRELDLIGYANLEDEEDPNTWMHGCILELLEVLSAQGHSGSSMPYCISMVSKLALQEPLSPLTGEDDEWEKAGPNLYQNKRCSRVFKDGEGNCYDVEGIIFKPKNGSPYISSDSSCPVVFPYTPVRKFVEIETSTEVN